MLVFRKSPLLKLNVYDSIRQSQSLYNKITVELVKFLKSGIMSEAF